ncbi:MAG: XdhC family protein [Chloroflexia bacterium]|nr:XdhC family protein [Chloroflexia bacterium]
MTGAPEAAESNIFDRIHGLTERGVPVAVATVVRGPSLGQKLLLLPDAREGSLGSSSLDDDVDAIAREMLLDERSGVRSFTGREGERIDAFIDVFPPPPSLLIFGAVHVAQALVTLARPLGYQITVVDARQTLATAERFPDVDELIVSWPDDAFRQLTVAASTDIAILTHDPKFDEPALLGALSTPARYIGAVGSRSTNADRRERLLNSGVSPENLKRVHGPIGLDIGGETPEEMAISILAEMIAARHGRSGGPLTGTKGPIRGERS